MFRAFLKILAFFGNKSVNFWSIGKKVEGMTDHIIRYKKTPFRVIPKSKPAGFLISGLFWIIMEQCAISDTRIDNEFKSYAYCIALSTYIFEEFKKVTLKNDTHTA